MDHPKSVLSAPSARGRRCIACLRAWAALLCGVGTLLRGQAAEPRQAKPQPSCEVLSVQQQVEILPKGAAQWKAATPGEALRIGDRLRTGKQSRATVRLSDASVLRVNELTTIELQPPPQEDKKPLIDLKSG